MSEEASFVLLTGLIFCSIGLNVAVYLTLEESFLSE